MSTRIKICGITNFDDAEHSARLGADALGFIFYKKSPRFVAPKKAREIISGLDPFVSTVGVFVDESVDSICETAEMCRLSAVQVYPDRLNTNEAGVDEFSDNLPFETIRAIRAKNADALSLIELYKKGTTFLIDTYKPGAHGGTGETFDWNLVRKYISHYNIIIAGGLNAENVGDVIGNFAPYGVDVASGVELEPGKKDPEKLRRFIINAKQSALNGDINHGVS